MVQYPVFSSNPSLKTCFTTLPLSDQNTPSQPLQPLSKERAPSESLEWYQAGETLMLVHAKYAEAVKYLQMASMTCDHNGQAQALLGFCYEFGLGLDQDFKSAEKLYATAGVQGNGLGILLYPYTLACARLSFLRRYGRPGVIIDRMEAEEWVKRVSGQGIHALSWLVKAADEFHLPAACYALGVCYHDGCVSEEENLTNQQHWRL